MDGSRFDSLTRSFALSGSRRRLIGGLIAGAFGLVGLHETGAEFICRDGGRVCREHADCCSKNCEPPDATGRRRCTGTTTTTTTSTTTSTTSTTTTSGPTTSTTTTPIP